MLHHRNIFIVTGIGGLGSKLISFMSAIRIAAEYNQDIIIKWSINRFTCTHKSFFGDIEYMTDYYGGSYGGPDTPKQVGLCFIAQIPSSIESNCLILTKNEQHLAYKIGTFRQVTRMGSWPDDPEIIDLFRRTGYYFNRLPLSKYVTDTMDSLLPQYNHNTIGVHLRKKWLYNRFRPAKDRQIYEIIERYDKFYLATDCVPTENRFRKRYGSRMISCPRRARPVVWDYTSNAESLCHMGSYPPAAQQDAFVDILMLSRTIGVVASGSSSFSVCSSIIGCIPLWDVCPCDRKYTPDEFEYSKNNVLS